MKILIVGNAAVGKTMLARTFQALVNETEPDFKVDISRNLDVREVKLGDNSVHLWDSSDFGEEGYVGSDACIIVIHPNKDNSLEWYRRVHSVCEDIPYIVVCTRDETLTERQREQIRRNNSLTQSKNIPIEFVSCVNRTNIETPFRRLING